MHSGSLSQQFRSPIKVLYLDFDLVFFKDPLKPILKAAEKAEMLVSRDLGGECINIGATRSVCSPSKESCHEVVYMKSHPTTARFLQERAEALLKGLGFLI